MYDGIEYRGYGGTLWRNWGNLPEFLFGMD